MQKYLDGFCDGLRSSLGEDLVSVILYGSAVKSENISKQSDVNIMVVVKKFSLECLSSIEKIISRAERKADINPVFWTEDELKNSVDVFPIEFTDIKESYRVLYGRDIISEISIDTKNLRHQLEFELRSKLLRLRTEWLSVKGSKSLLFDFLTRAGTSLLHLFNYAQKLLEGKMDNFLAEPFKKCVLLKKKEIKLGRAELEKLYEDVHNSVNKIISSVNELDSVK
ncbi:MAG: hypothetical protein HY919_04115 [Elusimicrobia bacterium]|nr:hypothetical protein [Elusimicrobiota bacterium]